ncbi:MAG: hypothetical protein GY925_03515 [Actinomycetia bacterium]|nr:hypothetical protein [Actinomycetes bacterium]
MQALTYFRWDDEQAEAALPLMMEEVTGSVLGPGIEDRNVAVTMLGYRKKDMAQMRLPRLGKAYPRLIDGLKSGGLNAIALRVLGSDARAWSFLFGYESNYGKRTDRGFLKWQMPDEWPLDPALAKGVTELLSLCCEHLDVTAGGAVAEDPWEYGCYAKAASPSPGAARYVGDAVLDYSWQVVLPPAAALRLDLPAIAGLVETYRPVVWSDGRTGAVTCLAPLR